MAAGIEVTISAGTSKFNSDHQHWRDQIAAFHALLAEDVGVVSRRGVPQPGVKGAVDSVILALGSSGALTATVTCFRAWLKRDKTRTLTVRWTDDTGAEQTVTVTGDNLDDASFQTLADAIRKRIGGG